MTNQYRLLQSTRTPLLKKGLMAIMAVALLAVSVVSNAQTTTASIRGKVQDENGAIVSGASVVVDRGCPVRAVTGGRRRRRRVVARACR
jgi:hypothetical protein